ncbi:MAG: NUDIX domain-containing protein [Eubacterium sp.]
MLHRTKKKNDINEGKWIGVGGHTEGSESPEECLKREVQEETGLKLLSYKLRGLITL